MCSLEKPSTDPTPIFEHFRGAHGTELLVAATCHLKFFDKLAKRPLTWDEMRQTMGLAERPLVVLTTALRAMGTLTKDGDRRFACTPLAAEHLVDGGGFAGRKEA